LKNKKLIIVLDQVTRWSSTANMLYNFLNLYKPIKSVISISESKAFKNKAIDLSNTDIKYLENCLQILLVFVKTTTKLQAENYPTAYYIIPDVYNIYYKLEKLKEEFKNASIFFYKKK
jgi:hypothetical protein